VGEQPGRASQALVVSGLPGQVGEEVAQPPAALGVEPEQDLGQGQANQLGIGEARRPGPRRTPSRMKRSSVVTYGALMRVSSWDSTYPFSAPLPCWLRPASPQ
jgi:hypothetical protein